MPSMKQLLPLIEAAPDLLRAAKHALTALRGAAIDWSVMTDDEQGVFPGLRAVRELEQAIAKAERKVR